MTDQERKIEVNQSVADRVLSAFVATVGESKDLFDVSERLKPTLLDTDNLKEDALRKALFGEGEA